jgi:hypothetical protein
MKKPFILLLTCTLMSGVLYGQTVKQPTTDTAKYRANDRLRTAGPKNGWKNNKKINSIKSKNDTIAVKPKTDSLKKRN